MDNTPEYIEMCRKATEIQELWEPKVGDWTPAGCCDLIIYTNPKGKFTFLPRQDQLQEMVPNFNIYGTTERFSQWVRKDAYCQDVKWLSMEQLWLAFVMHEKYGKKWDGKDWEHN